MYTPITGTGDGAAPVVTINFPFLDTSHVKASVDGADVAFTWTGMSQITFSAPVPHGSAWKVYRDTSLAASLVDFTDGSVLTEADLDKANSQHQYLDQELSAGLAQASVDATAAANAAVAVETSARIAGDNALLTAVSGISFSDATLPAATRAFMAAMDPTSGVPALLTEAGRNGAFIFSSADHFLDVAADPLQGVFVAPSAGTGLATDGSQGAWVRAGLTHVLPDWFGAVGDGTTDDKAALDAAHDLAKHLGIPFKFGPKDYRVYEGLVWDLSEDIEGWGATLTIDFVGDQLELSGGGIIKGLHIDILTADTNSYLNVSSGVRLLFNKVTRLNAMGGIPLYLRDNATGFRALGNRFEWYGGPNVFSTSDWRFIDNDFINPSATASDDGIAIKSSTARVHNWVVALNRFYGTANMVGVGSQVGLLGAADPDSTFGVYNGHLVNNYGEGVGVILYIKPGAIDGVPGDGYDFRDGIIDGIVVEGNEIFDPAGLGFQNGIALTVGRGTQVRNITGGNNLITARAHPTTSTTTGALHIALLDFSATMAGTQEPAIRDVSLGIRFVDPFGGYPAGTLITAVGTAGPDPYGGYGVGDAIPGNPLPSAVIIEAATPGFGVLSNVSLDIDADGTETDGITIGPGFDNVNIRLNRLRLKNINRNGSTSYAGVNTASKGVRIGSDVQIDMLGSYPYKSSIAGGFLGPTDEVFGFTAAAGTGADIFPWQAKQRSQLVEARLLISNTPTPDDTNYTTLELKNKGGTDVDFADARTRVTAFGPNDIAIAPQAGASTVIYDLSELYLDSQRTQTLFERATALHITKLEAGTGAALNDARFMLMALPY